MLRKDTQLFASTDLHACASVYACLLDAGQRQGTQKARGAHPVKGVVEAVPALGNVLIRCALDDEKTDPDNEDLDKDPDVQVGLEAREHVVDAVQNAVMCITCLNVHVHVCVHVYLSA
jgi:hypothetical protein